jgi:hypothetical protein
MKDATQRNVAIAVASFVFLGLIGYFLLRSSDARVSGVVTLDGQAVADAEIVFLMDDEENPTPIVAHSDDKGKYKLIGNTARGIPTGKYKVVITKLAGSDRTELKGEKLVQAREQGLLPNILPPIYGDRSTTPLQLDIRRGNTTVNLELKSQP